VRTHSARRADELGEATGRCRVNGACARAVMLSKKDLLEEGLGQGGMGTYKAILHATWYAGAAAPCHVQQRCQPARFPLLCLTSGAWV